MPVPPVPVATAAPRTRAARLVDELGARIRAGRLAPGAQLPTEAGLRQAFGVSRTVVREALSQLQAAGLVATRHGVGTFVLEAAEAAPFRVEPRQLATLQDVVAVLELRLGLETEAAALAAMRRSARQLAAMRRALADFEAALALGDSGVEADFRLHAEIARATGNAHFSGLMASLGSRIIPRGRLPGPGLDEARLAYLRRVHAEHESIVDAIARQDAEAARAAMRTHLGNSRERRRREAEHGSPVVR